MAKDGVADGRRMVVFVLADCDPAGHQMAVSIGRKLQALRNLCFPELEFEVVPVALTVQQVRDLGLPSTPLKETEKRADKWREAFGIEQTEIDALATLRPRDLETIVEAAIEPYFDSSLSSRVRRPSATGKSRRKKRSRSRSIALRLTPSENARPRSLKRSGLRSRSINSQLRMAVDEIVELPEAIVPQPEVDEKLSRQAPLISSSWSWVRATRALNARKAYGDGS